MTELRADARRNLERVLDAAEQAFGASGPDASIDEIARLAGVGHGTVFRRFPTKDDLMYAVIERHVAADARDRRGGTRLGRSRRGVLRLRARGRGAEHDDARPPHAASFTAARSPARPSSRSSRRAIVSRAQRAGAVRRDVKPADVRLLVRAALTSAPPGQWRRYLDVVLDGLRA